METTITALRAIVASDAAELPPQSMLMLLLIARSGLKGTTSRELINETRLPESSVQRSLQRLGTGAGEGVRNVGPGLALISRGPGAEDPRAYLYTLSKKGKQLLTDARLL